MSIYFEIQTNSAEEFQALESEGAPCMNMANSNGLMFLESILGVVPDYSGTLDAAFHSADADGIMERAARMDRINLTDYWSTRAEAFLEIAKAAAGLQRNIVFL